jgi:hypothetical protein
MKPLFPRHIVAFLGAGLLLAGCASHPSRSTGTTGANPPPQATSESHPAPTAQGNESATETHTHRTTEHATSAAEQTSQLPDNTGIPACDDYLASYVACHRAAAIYKPDQIQGRYEAMRTSLLRDSQDPEIRPQLTARCNSLASQLRQALHGKSCEGSPASAASGGSD